MRLTLVDTLTTRDGLLVPGEATWRGWHSHEPDDGRCLWTGWTNCDGRHLTVVVPGARNGGGHAFDLMGRAGNCGSKDDTEHRCWVVHMDGDDISTLTVDKDGRTCVAGAGSLLVHPGAPDDPIAGTGWHGFVAAGGLVPC